jgi:molybdopterin/thiamine biosynthesis adenylyltransferase
MNITIVGLGGIGSILANTISRFLNSKESFKPININLVDGDDYEQKNTSRQEFYNFGNKANVKSRELSSKFHNINYKDYPMFLDENNISEVIHENSIIFVSVDNHKTRRLVSYYAKKLNAIIVISGGNELTDGNVQIFIRKGGENVTPSLTDYHPEIENPLDKSPDEMSCEELSRAEPQLYFTNFMVAGHMCSALYNIIERNNYKISEVYFDILSMNSNSKTRVPKNIRG